MNHDRDEVTVNGKRYVLKDGATSGPPPLTDAQHRVLTPAEESIVASGDPAGLKEKLEAILNDKPRPGAGPSGSDLSFSVDVAGKPQQSQSFLGTR